METLHQTLTGSGFDLNCDGVYDPDDGDVLPWRSSPDDPFAGLAGSNAPHGSEGLRGGVGLRPFSLPVVVWTGEFQGTDPDLDFGPNQGYAPWGVGPGGCPDDAGHNAVIDELNALNAVFVGVGLSGEDAGWGPHQLMEKIARETGSMADLDDDGAVDDPLVFSIPRDVDTGHFPTLEDQIGAAIEAALRTRTIETVTIAVDGEHGGMVARIEPETQPVPGPEQPPELTFSVTFQGVLPPAETDQLVRLSLVLHGDGVAVDEQPLLLIVPGTGKDRG